MPRLHAIETLLDEASGDVVRAAWQSLRDAGLRSQLDHQGLTNAPHLTVLAVPTIDAADENRAMHHLGPLLPLHVRTTGLAVFGDRKMTLAWLLDVGDDMTRAVLALRAATVGHQHGGWLPHVTLARGLPRSDLPRALEVVGPARIELVFTSLRRWNPDQGTVRPL